MSGQLPLEGIRVLAVEQFGAGPWATLQLADLGAEVIKIESPGSAGDVGRYVPPYQSGEDSLFFETFNRGKRSISLDLKDPGDTGAFRALARDADVVFSNLRGDQPARLGLTYADLADTNQHIVCCSLSGFGNDGPRAREGAYDYVIQGLAGWMSLTGEPEGPPAKSGLSLVDLSAGYVATIAMLAGLWQARETGLGCDCDISLFETAIALLSYIGTWSASTDYEPQRLANSAHPSLVPFQLFPTQDGWIVVGCAKQKFWERLCVALGREDLLQDARYATFEDRLRHREAVHADLCPVLAARTTDGLLNDLTAVGVPCGPVNSVSGALADRQAIARGVVRPFDHPRLGRVNHVASPLRLKPGGTRPMTAAPQRGADTEEILKVVVAEQCNDGAAAASERGSDRAGNVGT